jgi:protocatechuate 3,4-dioxygenase, beta subunit
MLDRGPLFVAAALFAACGTNTAQPSHDAGTPDVSTAQPIPDVGTVDSTPAQPRPDLYQCDGCEAALERDPSTMDGRATLAGPDEPGERLILRGTVSQTDRRTPAANVVIYAHHTNAEGLYANGSDASVYSRSHGRLRGWVKTGADGRYQFDTIKPAPYPSRTMPAHIHLYIVEPGRRPYYIDDVVFDGEFAVDDAYRQAQQHRGGSGIVTLTREGEAWLAVRDIVLEPHPP